MLTVLGALAVTMPRTLSQPLVYLAIAEVHFDIQRYSGLYENGKPGRDFEIALKDAAENQRQQRLAQRDLRFGSPAYRVNYLPQAAGLVQVQGVGATATEAQTLANTGAEQLVRQIRAAGGREVLRNLLGWEMVSALREEKPASIFQNHLRTIIERNAFPMSRPLEPISARISIENLSSEEQNDVTRALEARYDLWTLEINTHNATLDLLCQTTVQPCWANSLAVQQEGEVRNRAIERRQAIDVAIAYMLKAQGMSFQPDKQSSVYRVVAPLPLNPIPRHTGLLLILAVFLGLTFGLAGIAVDRSAGVMLKLRELWSYRELIRNLVVRDLQVRYKGSALGYLWTQLAPLLMMLIFLFVFTILMPSGIALFPVFLLSALLPWNFCSEAVMSGARSVIDNANLIKKVFFPREVLPLVSVFSSLLNYLLSLPMMFFVMALTQMLALGHLNFSWTFAYLPILLLIETLFLIGVAFFLSALAVFFRDIVHLVGIFVQFWFFLTPVFYSLENIGSPLARLVRWLNPMASLIEFYREILYGNTVGTGMIPTPGLPALDSVLRVFLTTLLVLASGYWFFQRHSEHFGEDL